MRQPNWKLAALSALVVGLALARIVHGQPRPQQPHDVVHKLKLIRGRVFKSWCAPAGGPHGEAQFRASIIRVVDGVALPQLVYGVANELSFATVPACETEPRIYELLVDTAVDPPVIHNCIPMKPEPPR